MAIADGAGLPISLCTASALPHERKLVKELIEQRFTEGKPERLIGEKAYDSDPLDHECYGFGSSHDRSTQSQLQKPNPRCSRVTSIQTAMEG
jgi:hypothetical protein